MRYTRSEIHAGAHTKTHVGEIRHHCLKLFRGCDMLSRTKYTSPFSGDEGHVTQQQQQEQQPPMKSHPHYLKTILTRHG